MPDFHRFRLLLHVALLLGLVAPVGLLAQLPAGTGAPAAEIARILRTVDGEARVLMIGAHPDDEDTSMLAALALGEGVRTAYLSLNRGEGGQNLLGPELEEGLGLLRTGELLAARALDGAEQYFTRAFDFGFSRSAEETFRHWPEEEILGDVAWVVRTFRPHVLISVFTGGPQDGHGHHQAAGLLAERVFEVAGDAEAFPEQLGEGVDPWAPLRLFHLRRGGSAGEGAVAIPTGRFDPLLGRSFHQLAMESRSLHRSQDMGAARTPGPASTAALLVRSRIEGEPEDGPASLLDGIDTSLAGLARAAAGTGAGAIEAALEGYRAALADAEASLHPLDPGRTLGPLARALASLEEAHDAARDLEPSPAVRILREALERRRMRLGEALLHAGSVVVDLRATSGHLVPGAEVEVEWIVWNGGSAEVEVLEAAVSVPEGWSVERLVPIEGPVRPGTLRRGRTRVEIPPGAEPTRPYFLEAPRDGDLYRGPDDASLRGLPGTPPPVIGTLSFAVAEARSVGLRLPATHVEVDKALGEVRTPLFVVPQVGVRLDRDHMAWPLGDEAARTVPVHLDVRPGLTGSGTVELVGPAGWGIEPSSHEVVWPAEGGELRVEFRLSPPSPGRAESVAFRALARAGNRVWEEDIAFVTYEHVDPVPQPVPANLHVVRFPVSLAEDLRIGYLMGSGDAGADALRDLGVSVTLLDPAAVRAGDFEAFDVLVLGIRSYETRPDLVAANDAILAFARGGGTVLVQYNKYELPEGGFAPYPIGMARPHDRVTNPAAPVRFLDPDHPALTVPNRLAPADFDGWVQERGLYFLSEWDSRYTPVLGMSDEGLPPNEGSLVIAPVGAGLWAYTGLALFRQIPAGVPGAYRILANLVSLRGSDLERPPSATPGAP